MKPFICCLLLTFGITCTYGQQNFTYTPEKPQPGDVITISYKPGGILADKKEPVEAVMYSTGSTGRRANDLQMKKSGDTYTATIPADTSRKLIYFGFSSGKDFDTNKEDGYWIQFYDGEQPRKRANVDLAEFFVGGAQQVGISNPDNAKALESLEREFELYPETRKDHLLLYARALTQAKKEEAPALIQKEIEDLVKAGLEKEEDYGRLQNLYNVAKLRQQSMLIDKIKKEKFPNGKWTINDEINKYLTEKDLPKKEEMLAKILSNIESNPDWKTLEQSIPFFTSQISSAYIAKEDWEGMRNAVQKYGIKGADLAGMYNNTAWGMQEKDKNLEEAEKMSAIATNWTKEEWKNPSGKKPDYLTEKGWEKSRANMYAMYADTYAMIQYKLGNYKKALPYAEDAAIKIYKGKSADMNNTYALVAEKALSPAKYIPQLESFVKDGVATSAVKDLLKKNFKPGKNGSNYEEYVAKLEENAAMKMLAELRKNMISNPSPQFALMDLSGNKVDIAELKNKIVIVDFWATWCGPCKASFPGMQKMVTQYKDDPDVKFVFINTWETEGDKEKLAGDFIKQNKYDFQVLMDNDSKVVEKFGVSGIPTKFVIDKSGTIRFKSVGYNGSDDKLVSELTAMINLAKEQ